MPVSGAQSTELLPSGLYVAEVRGSVLVDLLSPSKRALSSLGSGTLDHALAGEVWLSSGAIDAEEDQTTIADIVGTASRGGRTFPFSGKVTISRNRASAPRIRPIRAPRRFASSAS